VDPVIHRSLVLITDMYEVPDAIPPIHAVSSYVATDKDPSKFRSIFSDNLQPIATRGKIARGTLLVDIGCSNEHAPPSLVITTKLAAAIYGGAANNKYKYSIQYCPCGTHVDGALFARTGLVQLSVQYSQSKAVCLHVCVYVC